MTCVPRGRRAGVLRGSLSLIFVGVPVLSSAAFFFVSGHPSSTSVVRRPTVSGESTTRFFLLASVTAADRTPRRRFLKSAASLLPFSRTLLTIPRSQGPAAFCRARREKSLVHDDQAPFCVPDARFRPAEVFFPKADASASPYEPCAANWSGCIDRIFLLDFPGPSL